MMCIKGRPVYRARAAGTVIAAALVACLLMATAATASTNYHWYVGGKAVGASPVLVKGTSETAFSTGWSVGGAAFEAKCSAAESGGSIENPLDGSAGTLSNGSLNLSGCTVTSPPNKGCKVGMLNGSQFEPGVIRFASMVGKAVSSPVGISFSPTSGTNFVKYSVRNCSVSFFNGDWSYQGLLKAPAVAAKPGSYEFSATASGLTMAGNQAYLKGVLKLTDQSSGSAVTLAP